ncbi:MAG: hypothetical protein NVS3B19_00720 [Ginsengibacter sp.]
MRITWKKSYIKKYNVGNQRLYKELDRDFYGNRMESIWERYGIDMVIKLYVITFQVNESIKDHVV